MSLPILEETPPSSPLTDSPKNVARNNAIKPPRNRAKAVSPIEADTQERGRRLFADVEKQEKRKTAADFFYDRLMALSTSDDTLKVELFRFVDALPALHTPESVSRHLQEYLLRPDIKLPPGAAQVLQALSALAPSRSFLSKAANIGATMMARRFIAGANAKEAAQAVARLRRQNMTFTLDLLGEAVTSEAEAVAYQEKYLTLLREMPQIAKSWPANAQTDSAPFGANDAEIALPKVNVSVKLSSLYARFDPMASDATCEAVKARLRPILTLARQNNVFVNFDMEQHDYCVITQRIFQEIFCEPEYIDWPDVGIVSQAYLKRSLSDLHELAHWAKKRGTPVWVRLVKGAYWDFETIISAQRGHDIPVYQVKAETDANFEACTELLIDNWRVLRPAIASHNIRSSAHAQALASAKGLPPRAVEYQVLFGMGEPIGRALAAQNERVRVYVPFGELLPGMAYLVRRLLENTSNDSFIRSAGNKGSIAKLLASPSAPRVPAKQKAGGAAFTNEPEADFAAPDNQRKMREALTGVEAQLGQTVPIVINGREETSTPVWERFDPSDISRVASRPHFADVEQAERAIGAAYDGFAAWRDTPVKERADILRRVADEFNRRRFEISAWQVYECGKPWREADADVAEAIDFCRYYAREMERLAGGQKRNMPGEWNEYFYEARGVAVVIAPWNFPLAILTGMATAALVAGNTVVMKPSEQASRTGYFLMEALQAAGCPASAAHFLPGDGEAIGPTLTDDSRTSVIAFTGSRAVGLSIMESAAKVRPGQKEIKQVIAELGGKNAIIVDDDADLDEAVLGTLASFVGFAGQKCSACSRVIVIGSAYAPFCARLKEAVQSICIGPASDPATTLGPVVDADAQARVLKYAAIGQDEGRVLAHVPVPDALKGTGYYIPAVVVENCPPDGKLCQEEVFGPVLAVLGANHLTEALRIADGTPYALTGGLYSRSPKNIERVRREFRVGNLYINRKITGALVDRQPFGGARMSGVGAKAGGPDYLPHFLYGRTITESVMRRGFAPAAEMSGGGI